MKMRKGETSGKEVRKKTSRESNKSGLSPQIKRVDRHSLRWRKNLTGIHKARLYTPVQRGRKRELPGEEGKGRGMDEC